MSQPKILVVDDSRLIRKAIQRELQQIGALVTQANDGIDGFEKAHADHFDLIISDVDMPRMDGFTLCEKLKGDPVTCTIPVVICSSRDNESAVEHGFRVGADGYLPKSGGSDVFRRAIRDMLERADIVRDRLVLVVDDSQLVRGSVKRELEQARFRVVTAENGKQALDILSANGRVDLIVSDLEMPVMNGLELLTALKADERWLAIPFLVMTSQADQGTIRRLYRAGAAAYVPKPFNGQHLVHVAEKLLSDHFLKLLHEKERLQAEHGLLLASITSLIQALEARDLYTRGHSEAVAEIAVGMGRKMGLDRDQMEKLEIAARLHDLGKIGIPDAVLLKPGKLTQAEYEIIKTHPTIGADILRPIPSMSDLIPAVQSHHERLDGTGYPHGLKNGEIPLFARIIAVGDIYHALTSTRPYRDPMPEGTVLQIINDARGTHLCPECVAIFLDYLGA
ncbi:response regulator RpfG family c-di-GMP phosphodiesterase [Desulfobaculum xiamenense]|uniref:Response regulator RpfG family c-di-GMP phosphodiesterase n=1 Tax=Desulfobaculum xiamenense TaxID=995050 RepID=A0A846QLZ4_9BACT|nr:response regulator [Desulfobaculum xiamenense]NJB68050.1 response regulator RpfG family c-di-GMP phosphodiesterase [Desulfobaculum xiamenense]